MSKKILLIYPPSPVLNREDRCQQPTRDLIVIPPLPPTDLMYLASIAERQGLEAKIQDYSQGGDYEKDLREFKPDYLVVNIATPTLLHDLEAVKKAKEICPNIITIAKGAAFLALANRIMSEHDELDFGILGEAEITLKEILSGIPRDHILGIYYKENGDVKFTGERPFIEDLDSLPFPARHLVDNNIYRRPDNNKVQATIKVSRGCPFHCFFCLATPVSGSKVRRRSPENIVAEIRECVEKYNIKNFLFWSEEMAQMMYKSGCRLVSIGVESGSQDMLNKMGKHITLDDVRRTVKVFKKAKIRIYNYFVIGLPWETEETAEETIKFAIELDSDFISFYTATPLPGSRFYDYAEEHNLFDKETSFENAYYYPAVNTHYLSRERVFELHKSAIKRFYLRPMYILRMLSRIRTFEEVKNYFKAGMNVLLRK